MKLRFLFFIFGFLISGVGNSLMILSDFGAGFWISLFEGLSDKFGFTTGTWFILVQLFVIVLNAFLLKTKLDFLALLTLFCVGLNLDFWLEIVFKNLDFTHSPLYIQIIVFCIGILILGFGIGTYIVSNFSPVPVDKLPFSISQRFSCKVSHAFIIVATLVIIITFAIDGPVGIGTFVSALGLGYIIQFSHEKMNYLFQKLNN